LGIASLVGCGAPDRFALTGGGRRQKGECLVASTAGLGVVDDERLAVGIGDRQLLVAELERADLRVVEQAGAAALGPGVVPSPQLTEAFAADRQLADQLVEPRVIDVGPD
jgi:hypothetical protein